MKKKIKVRNDLNADTLFSQVRSGFEKIPDHRSKNTTISLHDALMSGFAMFSLKDSSLLAF
ncbi:MAG TPA: transposase, partial [Candidatus Nanoarchaeia archaeon]|nr:transposase [Candidatus Nanoarchaeia archaeon]